MDSSSETLQSAWLDRWNQRIEPALQSLIQFQTARKWSDIVPEGFIETPDEQKSEYLEALLLKGSLLRAQGFKQKSSALLSKTDRLLGQYGIEKPFRLLFELGIDHWVEQDIAHTLEYLLLAEQKATTAEEKAFTAANILLSLEALDLEREEAEKKLESLLTQVSNPLLKKNVLEQYRAYQMRKLFYQKMQIEEEKVSGQAEFFQSWVLSLPYMHLNRNIQLPNEYLWQGSYRLRTLARIWIPADGEVVRASDAIDRLYLWVWLAMAAKPEMTKEKIFSTLESILKNLELENQSKENLLLLRNALGWTEILFPAVKQKTLDLMKDLKKISSGNYPLLEAEFDLQLQLQEDSIFPDSLFSQFPAFQRIYNEMKSHLPFLQEKLSPILARTRNYGLIVDLVREEVMIPDKGIVMTSKVMTEFLSKLSQNDSCKVQDFDGFDLANCIYRVRKVLGPKAIVFKRGHVFRGVHWPKTLLVDDHNFSGFEVEKLKLNLVESESYYQAARVLLNDHFQRKDLEKKMKVSKATANRMLIAWIENGSVAASGKAKATAYVWRKK